MRLSFSILGSVAILAVLPLAAAAQGNAVQLPTWSSFSTSTTVVVPDRGSASMGGMNRASSGRNEYGVPLSPLRNSSMGSQMSASSSRVTATIHDFEAMEQAVLSQSDAQPAPRGAGGTAVLMPRVPGGNSWVVRGESAPDRGSPANVADVQAQRASKKAVATDEAAEFFDRAQKAEADGKPSVAKIYYQMVVRRADGALRDKATARLDVLAPRASKASQLVNTAR